MSDIPPNQLAVLLFIPIGGLILLMIDQHEEEKTKGYTTGREKFFLMYNKDEIMKGLLASEGHLKNISSDKASVETGFYNCVVKHLAEVEGHADEAICHSLVVADAQTSSKFQHIRDETRDLRHKVQEGIPPQEAIIEVRKIRREFESFNPEFDVTKCESCKVNV